MVASNHLLTGYTLRKRRRKKKRRRRGFRLLPPALIHPTGKLWNLLLIVRVEMTMLS
jgi:hypothetical protein